MLVNLDPAQHGPLKASARALQPGENPENPLKQSTSAELDFKFGWRWLIPDSAAQGGLIGFDDAESAFLRAAIPNVNWSIGLETAAPTILLIHADRAAGMRLEGLIKKASFAAVLCAGAEAPAWRKRLQTALATPREYALLPPDVPRVVVPLNAASHTGAGLNLHRPGRWSARVAVAVVKSLLWARSSRLLRQQVLLIASSHDAPPATIVGLLSDDCRAEDVALYLGTPTSDRKTVVLPLRRTAPSAILKVAGSEAAHAALTNEANVLNALGVSPVASRVPAVLDLRKDGSLLILRQEYRARKWCTPSRLDRAVIAFLDDLSNVTPTTTPLESVLSKVPDHSNLKAGTEVRHTYAQLLSKLIHVSKNGFEVLTHRTHGDMAPWNCAWTNKGLFVYDWEASRGDGLALSDLFYFSVAPALHIGRSQNPKRLLTRIFRRATEMSSVERKGLEVPVYLALWLLTRIEEAPLYGSMAACLAEEWR